MGQEFSKCPLQCERILVLVAGICWNLIESLRNNRFLMALSKCPGSNAMGGSELGEDDLLGVWRILAIQVGQRSLLGRAGQEA